MSPMVSGEAVAPLLQSPALFVRNAGMPSSPTLDLNSASAEDLRRWIKGLGRCRADLIVQARPIESIDDLRSVRGSGRGIGRGTLRLLRQQHADAYPWSDLWP